MEGRACLNSQSLKQTGRGGPPGGAFLKRFSYMTGSAEAQAESRRHPSALARAGVSPSPSAPPSGFPQSGHCDPPPTGPQHLHKTQ